MNLSENTNILFTPHAVQVVYVSLRSVNNGGNFNWRTKYIRRCISSSFQWIFLKFHTYHSQLKNCNWYKIGCNQSIWKGTLLEENSTHIAASRLLLNVSFRNSTPITHRPCHANSINLVAIGLNLRALYLKKEVTSPMLSRLLLKGSLWNSTSVTHSSCTKIGIRLFAIGQYERALY
jgi:hypothetical protein